MTELAVGLAGCGHISGKHVEGWRRAKGSKLVGLFDVRRPSAETLRARFPGLELTVFDSVGELAGECDILDICTPPQTHRDLLELAIKNDCHILVEKPVVTSVADWDRLLPALEASGRSLTVVHNLKFSRSAARAKQWIDEGRIGDLLRLEWSFMTSPASDRMLTDPDHWSRSLPGGRWFETLPHNLYLTHFFAGPMRPRSAVVRSGRPEHADEALIVLKSTSCLATVHFSSNCEINHRWGTLIGSKGIIDLDLLADAATLHTGADSKAGRAVSRTLTGALGTLSQILPDRAAYLAGKTTGSSPHARLIGLLDEHLGSDGPAPTPIDEVDYVIRTCPEIGDLIDGALAADHGSR